MSTNYIDQITDTAGTTHDISEGDSTRIFRATCPTAASTAAKVATLQTSNRNFSLAKAVTCTEFKSTDLTAGVMIAVKNTTKNTAAVADLMLNVNSTGAKTIATPTAVATLTTGNGTTYNTWGPYETVIFTYNGTYWVKSGSSLGAYTGQPISIATSTGTNQITLNHGTKYSLNVGGNSYIFTTPTDNNSGGTITEVKTSEGAHTTIDVTSGKAEFNVPTKTSHLTNDSGFITTDSDEKLKVEEVSTSLTTYYFILSDGTTNASIRQIDSDSLWYQEQAGVANSSTGLAALHIGNAKTYAEGNKEGRLIIHGNSQGKYICLMSNGLTSSHTLTFPDKTGTIALTSDIPSIPTVPTITLNGSDTTSPSFYAPTSAGTNGYVLKSNGSGAPTWTSATLTDTQVTSAPVTTATTYYLTGSTSSTNTTGGLSKHASIKAYVTADTSTSGYSYISIGNSTASGTVNAKQGYLRLYGSTAYYHELKGVQSYPSANRSVYFPRYAGDMYLTCVPGVTAVGGATTAPVYVDSTGTIKAVTSIPYTLLSGTPAVTEVEIVRW